MSTTAPTNTPTPMITPSTAAWPDLTESDIKTAPYQTLRRWSVEAGLGAAGKASDIARRLIVALTGTTKKHTHGLTKCDICGHPVVVASTQRTPIDDGRTLVTRYMRCKGKHRHTYPLKEIFS